MNKWCPDCTPGKGCGIYDRRPEICRDFECLWLITPELDDKYKPEKIKLYISGGSNDIYVVAVDPAYPRAWKEGNGKKLVNSMHKAGYHLLIMVGNDRTIIPGKDKQLPKDLVEKMSKHRDLLEVRMEAMRG